MYTVTHLIKNPALQSSHFIKTGTNYTLPLEFGNSGKHIKCTGRWVEGGVSKLKNYQTYEQLTKEE